MSVLVILVIGFLAGLCAGALGVGGGALIIPGLVLLLGVEQHTAQGVALAVIPFAAVAGTLAHLRQRNVHLGLVARIAPVAMVAALLGAWIAGIIAARFLSIGFGLLLLLIGSKMILSKEEKGVEAL